MIVAISKMNNGKFLKIKTFIDVASTSKEIRMIIIMLPRYYVRTEKMAEKTSNGFISTFLCCLALINLTSCQDQTGFISLDCGLQPENSSYNDGLTSIKYVSDMGFTDMGISMAVAPEYRSVPMESMRSVRSFIEGTRNCYTLQTNSSTKYLVRASFMYGNYDSRNEIPGFDLHLGPNKWDTVKLDSVSKIESKEIIHYASSESLQVCLVNTGQGTPFISALELRPLPNSSYQAKSGSLQLFARLDFGSISNQTVRYPDDVFDRVWLPYLPEGSKQLSSSTIVFSGNNNFRIPQVVMRGAAIPANATDSLSFAWFPNDPSLEFYVYFYFAELQELNSNQRREFVIFLNRELFFGPLVLNYLRATVLYSDSPLTAQSFQFSLIRTQNSTLPPLINAIEVYFANKLPQSPMDQNDLSAITSIKSSYGIKRNWQGDACVPQAYSWAGVTCSYNGSNSPRITALNLSNAELTGEIVLDISRLTQLQTLDLSNNTLSGPVPAFLAQLQLLTLLDLSNNHLTGPIPSELISRTKGGLSLRVNGNPSVCLVSSCEFLQSKPKKKKKLPSFVIPLVASVAGFFLIVSVTVIVMFFVVRKQNKDHSIHSTIPATSGPSLRRRDTASTTRSSLPRIESGMTDYELNETAFDASDLEPAQKKFSYSQIINITNGFETELGRGGLGRNYHGYLDSKEVTVKLLSSSTPQGYKQLKAEVQHLFRIHHKNLITLLGYCNEGDKMALVYEHMPNGNLKQHISAENSTTVFSWEDRLGIALDIAQGLEYLHTACKPAIIHRNVKCTNIFLGEKFDAKLGGFGLSRAFDAEEGTHLNTAIAGTPGYVDPEYYMSNILTEKSDVYSFGVVLLEIITAKPAIMRTQERIHISQWVETQLSSGNIGEVLDPKLNGDYDPNSASKAIEVAMACVSQSSSERPTMSQTVTVLKEGSVAETDRKKRMQTVSNDSVEELAIGFGATPRLR